VRGSSQGKKDRSIVGARNIAVQHAGCRTGPPRAAAPVVAGAMELKAETMPLRRAERFRKFGGAFSIGRTAGIRGHGIDADNPCATYQRVDTDAQGEYASIGINTLIRCANTPFGRLADKPKEMLNVYSDPQALGK
jgi:hypothetical protein